METLLDLAGPFLAVNGRKGQPLILPIFSPIPSNFADVRGVAVGVVNLV